MSCICCYLIRLSLMYRQPVIMGFRPRRADETNLRKLPSAVAPLASRTCVKEVTLGYVLRSAGLKSCHSLRWSMRHITPLPAGTLTDFLASGLRRTFEVD